jgi:hypothetical protein
MEGSAGLRRTAAATAMIGKGSAAAVIAVAIAVAVAAAVAAAVVATIIDAA